VQESAKAPVVGRYMMAHGALVGDVSCIVINVESGSMRQKCAWRHGLTSKDDHLHRVGLSHSDSELEMSKEFRIPLC
jgi:hypothetical protein